MINAQALMGTMLGTYTLQRLVGQGCSSAVFLAQQAQQEGQVVVKVVWSAPLATAQTASQRTVFLKRFRQEIAALTSLKHKNIVPVLDYGTHEGLAYLVMPYISGGTLRKLLEQEGPLALPRAATYLDQLAQALDYAHERGFVHRDCKPSNVLFISEGHLLLADFGLMKIVAERQTSQMRLLKSSTSLEALEYLAPEQVMGDVIDARTDIYALGVILYQMVTGKTPFQAGTPLQLATQLVQTSPPPPRSLRTDIPVAAEQVILRAMAKRSQDRYVRSLDVANAFRVALTAAGILPEGAISEKRGGEGAATPLATPRPRGLFDPVWQKTEQKPLVGNEIGKTDRVTSSVAPMLDPAIATPSMGTEKKAKATGLLSSMKKVSLSAAEKPASSENNVGELSSVTDSGRVTDSFGAAARMTPTTDAKELPARNTTLPPTRPRLGAKTGLLRAGDGAETFARTSTTSAFNAIPTSEPRRAVEPIVPPTKMPDPISPLPVTNVTVNLPTPMSDPGAGSTDAMASTKQPVLQPQSPSLSSQITGALMIPTSEQGNTGTYTLTGAVKVVQVPVAGQPGRYVTGLLPVLTPPPQTQSGEETLILASGSGPSGKGKKGLLTRTQQVLGLIVLVMVVLSGSGIFWFFHAQSRLPAKNSVRIEHLTPNAQAIHAAQATATAATNTILIDPLTQNIHNWPVATSGYKLYVFENGAYHITDNDAQQSAPAILAGEVLNEPLGYTLTMDEIHGNDSSVNNSFGMILRLNSRTVGNKNIVTFYCFEVVNTRGGQYQFWKYDNSKGAAVNPWKSVWQHVFGKEFLQGQGPKNTNTIKVFANDNAFTFTVNGKMVGTAHDSSLSSGEIGMLVNLKGTEVAFSNLLLTRS